MIPLSLPADYLQMSGDAEQSTMRSAPSTQVRDKAPRAPNRRSKPQDLLPLSGSPGVASQWHRPSFLRSDCEHWARRFPDDMFGNASQNEMAESLPSVSRHYDQIRAQSSRRLNNLGARIAHSDFDLAGDFAVDFLAREFLQPGSRGGIHLAKG